jgi:signal transduction histidine kinase
MVGKAAALLEAHEADLAQFLTSDPSGRRLPGYLKTLAGCLADEQKGALKELDVLRNNIDHIKGIVAMQQSYAKVSGVAESVGIAELVEDALRMNSAALQRHEITLVRDFQVKATITVERHKVLQILVNLIRNAKYACGEAGRLDKQITLQIAERTGAIEVAVIDNGVGIPAENLTRIFGHGFTTRKDGHGFGLHSGALAAREIGGELGVRSDGPGRGATFTLRLPFTSNDSKT